MDLADHVGARQHQDVGAVFAAPVVLLDIEGQRLDAAAHGAVAQQHAVSESIEQVGTCHAGYFLEGSFKGGCRGCGFGDGARGCRFGDGCRGFRLARGCPYPDRERTGDSHRRVGF